MAPDEKPTKSEKRDEKDKDGALTEAELGRVSGGAEPVSTKTTLGTPRKVEPIND